MPLFFFFNDTATTEIYTLSLHDALPISFSGGGSTLPKTDAIQTRSPRRDRVAHGSNRDPGGSDAGIAEAVLRRVRHADRKSTRLDSSHLVISYAVFCLEKKRMYS